MKRGEKEQATAEIMFMFKHYPRDQWMSGHLFDGKSRQWVAVFNSLIDQGMIKRRKSEYGYEYKWAAAWPEGM